MTVTIPEGTDLGVLGHTGLAAAQFTLADFAVTGLDQPGQDNFIDIAMNLDHAGARADRNGHAPVMAAFRFRVDSLFPTTGPFSSAIVGTRRAQRVSD